ncbi:MAG: DUF4177 domain-containing protein [Treponema sp.]|nr:DUF4177 domain-containing protein [Treponema sp.]MBR0099994.1 DUF4177 domain-containing protein [Treponema sp.]
MEQWEYKVLNFYSPAWAGKNGRLNADDIEQKLNELGNIGWEVVAVNYTDSTQVFLKRKKEC